MSSVPGGGQAAVKRLAARQDPCPAGRYSGVAGLLARPKIRLRPSGWQSLSAKLSFKKAKTGCGKAVRPPEEQIKSAGDAILRRKQI